MWDNRKYHFYLLFADTTKGNEPWSKTVWTKQVQPILDKIIKKSKYYDKTGLGVLAYTPKLKSEYFDEVKFGKLRWDEKSFEKWTVTEANKEIQFEHFDCWTPMRTVCGKIDSAPDIYIAISNEQNHPIKDKIKFDILMIIAIAEEIDFKGLDEITELSKVLNAKRTVYRKRRWGSVHDPEKNAQWSFINSIQDTSAFGIYKAETLDIHDTKFEDLKFEPYWTTIYSS
nr:hypothetical protein [Flavobacterium sp. ASV13]